MTAVRLSQLSTFVLGFSLSASVAAVEPVLTQHNSNARTGSYTTETTLNTSNVNATTFGKLFSRPVDDQIYSQPLYVPDLTIPGQGRHNVVFVTTVADSVYAFDADEPDVSTPLWQVNLLEPHAVPPSAPDISSACGINYRDFSGNFGIVGTPVIDPATGILYVVARSKLEDGTFVQKLHALDITTGEERLGGPVLINPTLPGSGDGGATVTFDALRENQRSALLLSNGTVYVAWAAHNDCQPYHGWVLGFDTRTLQVTAMYNDTVNGQGGGIWMSGQGPAADDNGNLFIATGNGTTDTADLGNSVIKLSPALSLLSSFTPYNYQALNDGDLDVGSGGAMLLPRTHLVTAGGKSSVIYVLNQDDLGGLSSTQSDDQIVQSFSLGAAHIHGAPVYWDGGSHGEYIYCWNEEDYMKVFKFDRSAGKFQTPYYARTAMSAPPGMPGGILSVSTNGTTDGTGIVWAALPLAGNAIHMTVPGILRAFDATDVTHELWDSEQESSRDSVGNFAKFNPPTIANGKVYLGTFSNQLDVYGLLTPAITSQPQDQEVVAGQPFTLEVKATGPSLSYQWRKDGTAIRGATSRTYTKNPATLDDAGAYDVVVSNSAGTLTSSTATVQVTAPASMSAPVTSGSGSSAAGASEAKAHAGCTSAGQTTAAALAMLLLARRRKGET